MKDDVARRAIKRISERIRMLEAQVTAYSKFLNPEEE